MRLKQDRQGRLEFKPSNLKITNEFYGRFEAISEILDQVPKALELVHKDLAKALDEENRRSCKQGRPCSYTSENVLRMVIVDKVFGESLRDVTIRIDDSYMLRKFTRFHDGPMMSHSIYCRLRNIITDKTWKKINDVLANYAFDQEMINGSMLRLDTTAVETNIHHPLDSWQLWDTYRVLARNIRGARELDPQVGREQNLQEKRAKKIHARIGREAGKKKRNEKRMEREYKALCGLVERILESSQSVVDDLQKQLAKCAYGIVEEAKAKGIVLEIEHYLPLARKVLDQAIRRVFKGENVPASEKVFSIFEPHTEMLIRGKQRNNIEWGHMIFFQQVEGKFITDYKVLEKRVADHTLVDPAVKSHEKLFGHKPETLAGDKGFHESSEKTAELEKEIGTVSICKKGNRTAEEIERESSPMFKIAQAFRAGIEGSISFLKRSFRMVRCFVKGLRNYKAEISRIVFAHNLVVLARELTA